MFMPARRKNDWCVEHNQTKLSFFFKILRRVVGTELVYGM